MPTKEYVLIAVDNRGVAASLDRDLAASTGHECCIVSDGNEGHELMFRRGAPVLLVAALQLPKRDGLSLVRGMRRLESGTRTGVILLAASDAERQRVESLRTALVPLEIMAMPYTPEILRRTMRLLGAASGRTQPPPSVHPPPSSLAQPSIAPSRVSSALAQLARAATPSAPFATSPPSVPPSSQAPVVSREREAALRLLTAATESLPIGLIVFDAGARVLVVNFAFERLFALRAGEVIGVRREVMLSRLAHGFVDPAAATELCMAPCVGTIPVTGEIEMSAPRACVLSWTATPVEIDGGPVQVVSCFDVNIWAPRDALA